MAKKKIKPRAMIGGVPVWCAYDEIVNCAELKPNPKNPNTHPAGQIKLLGKIIKDQGWRMPITVSKRSGLIVKGHGRLEAAFRVGILKAPVDLQDYESEAAEHADMVADNRLAELAKIDRKSLQALMAELKLTDLDMELTGFSQSELDKHFLEERQGLTDEDDVPGLKEKANTNPGDVYILGDHRLLCGDSTDSASVGTLMSGDVAAMVFTDPPYQLDTRGGGILKHAKSMREIRENKIDNFDPYPGLLASKTNIFFCNKPLIPKYINMAENLHYPWDLNIYHKRNTAPNYAGHLMTDAEYIIIIGEIEPETEYLMVIGLQKPNIGYSKDLYSKVFYGNKDKSSKESYAKPVALCVKYLYLFSNKGDLVLDFYGGTGSTLIACEKTYRHCRMIELDPLYCDVIVKRWEDFTGKKGVLQNG